MGSLRRPRASSAAAIRPWGATMGLAICLALLLSASCSSLPEAEATPISSPSSPSSIAQATPLATAKSTVPPEPTPTSGEPGNAPSSRPAISADGRYVSYGSEASNLVPGDTNGASDVFVHDRTTGRTVRVSVASDGAQAMGSSPGPTSSSHDGSALASDGRYVAFWSFADNLAPGGDNGDADVFVHDCATGQTERIPPPPWQGRLDADRGSDSPAISADGRWVAFLSRAGGPPGQDVAAQQAYVYDRQTGTLECVSTGPEAVPANRNVDRVAISGDARWVALVTDASNLDRGSAVPSGPDQVYLYDRQTRQARLSTTSRDGQSADGPCASPTLSADGRWLAFISLAGNLAPGCPEGWIGIYLCDLQAHRIEYVAPVGPARSMSAFGRALSLSPDGRWLAFSSMADDLVPGDGNGEVDVFLYDRITGNTRRVSVASDGKGAIGGSSGWPSVSADGRYVAFVSWATNLHPNVSTRQGQVYVHDMTTGVTELVSVASR